MRALHRAIPLVLALALVLAGCDAILDAGPGGPMSRGRVPGPGPTPIPTCETCVGPSRMPRITRLEYERALRAALGDAIAGGLRDDYLPADGRAGPFASNELLDIDDDGVEAYRVVGELVGERAAADADRVLGCAAETASAACVRAFVDRIGTALFRRPLTDAERAPYLAAFDAVRARSSAIDAVRVITSALVQSPLFLYRIEIGVPTGDPAIVRLRGGEVAARLAAFLWKSAPDDALLAAAASGELDTVEGVAREARRMIADARADVSIARFHTSWLGMEGLPTATSDRFPELEGLRDAMYRETGDFAVDVFRDDARLTTLLTAPQTRAGAELADLYGGERDATGIVTLPARERAGVLTHAGFLASHTPSPATAGIYRGRVIRDAFLCQTMPNPPPIDTVIAPDPELSARQQLEQKTSATTCTACHELMNPIGFLFEHYDGLGRYRTMDGTFPVDATGAVLRSDIEGDLDGAIELASALSASEEVDRCVARQWMRYALGRHESDDDEVALEAAYSMYLEADRDLRELLVGIATSDPFLHRRLGAAAP